MSRLLLAAAALVSFALLSTAADEPPKPKLGELLKGEVIGLPRPAPKLVGDSKLAYVAEVQVKLKAGQDISLTCNVVGKNRHVLLVLLDPAGVEIGISKSAIKTTTLNVEEVNANGEYRLLVFTSLIGPFTLGAAITPEEGLKIKAIEDEIKSLNQQLADAEARLQKAKTQK